jgi:hypothetical protein
MSKIKNTIDKKSKEKFHLNIILRIMQENARITSFNTWLYTFRVPLFRIYKQCLFQLQGNPKRHVEIRQCCNSYSSKKPVPGWSNNILWFNWEPFRRQQTNVHFNVMHFVFFLWSKSISWTKVITNQQLNLHYGAESVIWIQQLFSLSRDSLPLMAPRISL